MPEVNFVNAAHDHLAEFEPNLAIFRLIYSLTTGRSQLDVVTASKDAITNLEVNFDSVKIDKGAGKMSVMSITQYSLYQETFGLSEAITSTQIDLLMQ